MANFTLKTGTADVRGQKVLVRELTAGARQEVLNAFKADPLKAQIICAQHCALKDDGKPEFGPGDFDKVSAWPPDAVQAVSDLALELSGLTGPADPKG